MSVETTKGAGIQSDPTKVQIYADGIVSAYHSVGKETATKDSISQYAASGTISSHIDNEFSTSEQAAQQSIDFIQVLHGIHAEFQTTDANIANYIDRNTGQVDSGTACSNSGQKKNKQ